MLRALGPGSVSSVLKIGLDVFHVLLWIALIGLGLALLGALIAQPFLYGEPGDAMFRQWEIEARNALEDGDRITINGEDLTHAQVVALIRGPAIPVSCAFLMTAVGALVVITGKVRLIFGTLTRGDPFHPLNARRLRLIGFTLGGLELLNQLAPDLVFLLLPEGMGDHRFDLNLNLTAWFSVAVVLVLAEVFREGARLRREAELTI